MDVQKNAEQKSKLEQPTAQGQRILNKAQKKMGLAPFNRENFAEAKEMIRQHTATKATVNLRTFLEENVDEFLTWGVKNSLMFEVLSQKFNIGNQNSFNTIWKEVRENHKKALRVQRAQERAKAKAKKETNNDNDGGSDTLELQDQEGQVTPELTEQNEAGYIPTDADISWFTPPTAPVHKRAYVSVTYQEYKSTKKIISLQQTALHNKG